MKAGGSMKQEYTTKIALRLSDLGLSFQECREWKSLAHKKLDTNGCKDLLAALKLTDKKEIALVIIENTIFTYNKKEKEMKKQVKNNEIKTSAVKNNEIKEKEMKKQAKPGKARVQKYDRSLYVFNCEAKKFEPRALISKRNPSRAENQILAILKEKNLMPDKESVKNFPFLKALKKSKIAAPAQEIDAPKTIEKKTPKAKTNEKTIPKAPKSGGIHGGFHDAAKKSPKVSKKDAKKAEVLKAAVDEAKKAASKKKATLKRVNIKAEKMLKK